METTKNAFIYTTISLFVLIVCLCFTKIDIIKPCSFYVNSTDLVIAVNEHDKKYIKEYNSTYKLEFREVTYKIQIQDLIAKENGFYMYEFYCYNYGGDNFDIGLNNGYIDYGKESCLQVIL
ncbi:MAG: hypothetical protein LBQ45_00100 [Mycoplasmataceae bacterium]|jgi:hypothetical protein|nr:hypothetical protein [Mycoplasmataceae bacterium]